MLFIYFKLFNHTSAEGNIILASQSPRVSPIISIEDKFRELHVDPVSNFARTSSHVGDSGYTSFPGLIYTGLATPHNTFDMTSQIAETEAEKSELDSDIDSQNELYMKNDVNSHKESELSQQASDKKVHLKDAMKRIHLSQQISSNMGNFGLLETRLRTNDEESAFSIDSSLWGEDKDVLSTACSSENWEVPSTQLLEQLSKVGSRGSQRSEVQLRLVKLCLSY